MSFIRIFKIHDVIFFEDRALNKLKHIILYNKHENGDLLQSVVLEAIFKRKLKM